MFYFICRQIHFHACLICTLLNDFLFFRRFLTPPSPFRNVFLATLTTASNSSLNLWVVFFWGRTCFDRVGRKSETNNIFLGPGNLTTR